MDNNKPTEGMTYIILWVGEQSVTSLFVKEKGIAHSSMQDKFGFLFLEGVVLNYFSLFIYCYDFGLYIPVKDS